MRRDLLRRGRSQRRFEKRIKLFRQFGHAAGSRGQSSPYLLLPHLAMGDQSVEPVTGSGYGRTMGGIEYPIPSRSELFQAGEIITHVAVWRRDHTGRPAHHMIAAEQRALL